MKLNIGCGRNPLPGYVNIDRFPGAPILADAEKLPFKDCVFDEVLASHCLEHVERFAETWREIARVTNCMGGRLTIIVPYGMDYNPWHKRHFTKKSIGMFIKPGHNLEASIWWRLISVKITARGLFGYSDWPFGRAKEMTVVLERVAS